MSNSIKALIVVLIAIIAISGIYIISKPLSVEKLAVSVSSSFASSQINSSIKSILSSSSFSSISSTISSSSQSEKVDVVQVPKIETPKVVSQISKSSKNIVSIYGTFNSPDKSIELPCKDFYPSLTGANPAPFAPKYQEYLQLCKNIGFSVKIFKVINGEGKLIDSTSDYINS
jgi:hypothetical protein